MNHQTRKQSMGETASERHKTLSPTKYLETPRKSNSKYFEQTFLSRNYLPAISENPDKDCEAMKPKLIFN